MNIKKRRALMTLPLTAPAAPGVPVAVGPVRPGVPAAAPAPGAPAPAPVAPPTPVMAPVEIAIDDWAKFMFIDTAFLAGSILASNPNTELTSPATVVLSDPNTPGRYVLAATTKFPHNNMEVMVFHDTVYKDLFVIPTLEIYRTMNYLTGTKNRIRAYGINFSGKEGDTVPPINYSQNISASAMELPRTVGSVTKGGYAERDVGLTTRYSASSTIPTFGLNFGPVSTLFPALGFVADVHVFGYDSLNEWSSRSAGKQTVGAAGSLIVELPV